MLSGSGRTLLNLLDEIQTARLSAQVVLVIASKECLGAQRARLAGLPTIVLPGAGEGLAAGLTAALAEHRVKWIVLAGYLKKLPILLEYRGRTVNIHPSLLPKFGGQGMYGDRVHAAVIAAGETHSGCTVHLVDEEYDRGRVLLQRTCPVLPKDDAHTLAARVFELEKRAYPEALQALFTQDLEGALPGGRDAARGARGEQGQ